MYRKTAVRNSGRSFPGLLEKGAFCDFSSIFLLIMLFLPPFLFFSCLTFCFVNQET